MTTGKGNIEATIIADSINRLGTPYCPAQRITTFQLRYPRFIHAEFMTHRQFSRNASSSRAIPVKKNLERIMEQPAMPIHWGKNQPGMQAREQQDAKVNVYSWKYDQWGSTREVAHTYNREDAWKRARDSAVEWAERFDEAGYHKQIVNRITEPFQFISVVMTATEMENFFNLRLHPDAQPEFRELALKMHEAMDLSVPMTLLEGEWHLPYIQCEDMVEFSQVELLKISSARCARVSYLNHDNSAPNAEKDIELHDILHKAGHMSPFEHQATPMLLPTWGDEDQVLLADIEGVTHYDVSGNAWSGNFKHWIQYRQVMGDA